MRQAGVANEVRRVHSGTECLEKLRGYLQNKIGLQALVLLGFNAPNDDGLSALQQMKADERLRAVPAVVISGSLNLRDVYLCYPQGGVPTM